jgi:hypothetical protein
MPDMVKGISQRFTDQVFLFQSFTEMQPVGKVQ